MSLSTTPVFVNGVLDCGLYDFERGIVELACELAFKYDILAAPALFWGHCVTSVNQKAKQLFESTAPVPSLEDPSLISMSDDSDDGRLGLVEPYHPGEDPIEPVLADNVAQASAREKSIPSDVPAPHPSRPGAFHARSEALVAGISVELSGSKLSSVVRTRSLVTESAADKQALAPRPSKSSSPKRVNVSSPQPAVRAHIPESATKHASVSGSTQESSSSKVSSPQPPLRTSGRIRESATEQALAHVQTLAPVQILAPVQLLAPMQPSGSTPKRPKSSSSKRSKASGPQPRTSGRARDKQAPAPTSSAGSRKRRRTRPPSSSPAGEDFDMSRQGQQPSAAPVQQVYVDLGSTGSRANYRVGDVSIRPIDALFDREPTIHTLSQTLDYLYEPVFDAAHVSLFDICVCS